MQHRRYFVILPFVIACLLSLGCAPSRTYRRRPTPSQRIELGMTRAQVERRLGQPDSYAGKGRHEVWRYRRPVGGAQARQVTVIEFEDGRVISFERVAARRKSRATSPNLRPTGPEHGSRHGPTRRSRGAASATTGRPGEATPTARPSGSSDAHAEASDGRHSRAPSSPRQTAGRSSPPTPKKKDSKGPGDTCSQSSECGVGRQCKASKSGKRVCVGQGGRGAACRVSSDCRTQLSCASVRGGGAKTCR